MRGVNDCVDHDECASGYCSQFAVCNNTVGTYSCECIEGYQGDGIVCNNICAKQNAACGDHASCRKVSSQDHHCVCDKGYS